MPLSYEFNQWQNVIRLFLLYNARKLRNLTAEMRQFYAS